MKYDISDVMRRYRLAVRNLHNNYLRYLPTNPDDSNLHRIRSGLFGALVLDQLHDWALEERGNCFSDKWKKDLLIEKKLGPQGETVLYCVPNDQVGFEWEEYFVEEFDCELYFDRFYDWSVEVEMDNEFVQAKVLSSNDERFREEGYFLLRSSAESVRFYTKFEPYYKKIQS